jgi:RNA polymerase sigma-70 factor (ECF subfamily)
MEERTASIPASASRALDGGARFEDLFYAQRDRLCSALWLVTRDRHEAEEIAQEAFVRVWERWDRRGAPDDAVGYLFRTAMNVMRNRRRRAALALRRATTSEERPDDLAAVEAREEILRALGALTQRQRAAIVQVDLFDMSSGDAARVLGVRASTVRVLAARGRAALAEQIGAEDG